MATIIIAKNNGSVTKSIDDLGIEIIAYSQRNLTEVFQVYEVCGSLSLKTLVSSGDLIINNGTIDLNMSDSLEHIKQETHYEDEENVDPHEIDGHTDIPTKPTTGKKLIRVNDGIVEWIDGPVGEGGFRKGLSFWGNPTYNGEIQILGWYNKINTGIEQLPEDLLSENPITTEVKLFHSHVVLEILTSSNIPFTIRITGTTVDEPTGTYTENDTEDLDIIGNGYYQSLKSFISNIQLEIIELNKSCTLDIYKTTYWDNGNNDFVIKGIRLEWTPDQNNWDFNLTLYHHLSNGDMHEIDVIEFFSTDTILRAADGESGKYKRIDYDCFIEGYTCEGLIIKLDQRGIGNFFLEIKYES